MLYRALPLPRNYHRQESLANKQFGLDFRLAGERCVYIGHFGRWQLAKSGKLCT